MVFLHSLLKKYSYSVEFFFLTFIQDIFFWCGLVFCILSTFLLPWSHWQALEKYSLLLAGLLALPLEKQKIFYSKFYLMFCELSIIMMFHFLALTEFWLYPYSACTHANTLSSPPQNNFIGINFLINNWNVTYLLGKVECWFLVLVSLCVLLLLFPYQCDHWIGQWGVLESGQNICQKPLSSLV